MTDLSNLAGEDTKKLEKRYDVALSTRNFEIELFWKRSLFFWGFIASSFLGYVELLNNYLPLAIVIACFGFVCSVAWTLANRGSKWWQENWEVIVEKLENEVTGELFKDREKRGSELGWLSARKFSVSKLTIALSDFTTFIWGILVLYALFKLSSMPVSEPYLICCAVMVVVITFIFVIFMHCKAESSD